MHVQTFKSCKGHTVLRKYSFFSVYPKSHTKVGPLSPGHGTVCYGCRWT